MGAPALQTPPTVYEFRLPIRTVADLKLYVELTQGIRIPDTQVCPEHSTPWRAYVAAYFALEPVSVWIGSRGFSGKSFLNASLGLVEAQTLKVDVNILGGSGEQSKRVHQYMVDFWNAASAPRHLLADDPLKQETRLVWGNRIVPLMASQASVRGPHVARLRLDEVDLFSLDIFDASLGQTMSRHGIPAHTLISSTHHVADGTMTEVLKRAAANGWGVHRWCWKESCNPIDGWLPMADVERKRIEVTAEQFRVEYDLGEPSSEGRAILPDAVDAMFRTELGVYPGETGRVYDVEPPEAGATYSTGADWARKMDATAIVTLRTDVKPVRVVSWERRHRQPHAINAAAFNARLVRYPGTACHDGTGIGDVMREWLDADAEAFVMVGRARQELFTDYIAAIEAGGLVSPKIGPHEAAHRFCSNDDLFGNGHPPDEFVAGALAWRAYRQGDKPGVDVW